LLDIHQLEDKEDKEGFVAEEEEVAS